MPGKLLPSRIRWSAMAAILFVAALCIMARHWTSEAVAQDGDKTAERKPLVLDRAPARNIADPNPVFRAVVLDAEHGEIFVANDKESAGTSILVYPTQFTPTDRIMEPVSYTHLRAHET